MVETVRNVKRYAELVADARRAEEGYEREARLRRDMQRQNGALMATLEDALAMIGTREPAIENVLRSLLALRQERALPKLGAPEK